MKPCRVPSLLSITVFTTTLFVYDFNYTGAFLLSLYPLEMMVLLTLQQLTIQDFFKVFHAYHLVVPCHYIYSADNIS